jgi:hypothetical protein
VSCAQLQLPAGAWSSANPTAVTILCAQP